ncbi:MAG: tetratricopeptide repeat protein [Thermoanaerobaculia bacterium]|nr:tetratricopeptide repeat protein [Thermoanaerobaculia bacterium]
MRRALAALSLLLIAAAGGAATVEDRADNAFDFLVAESLVLEGSYGEAVELFGKLVERDPDEVYLRLEFAELLFRLGRLDEASEQASAARRLDGDDPEVLRLYGQIQLRRAEDDAEALGRAREAFEVLRQSAPEQIEPLVTLGQIYLSEGRTSDAADLFLELLAQRPGDRMLFSFLLEALERSDRLVEGEETIRSFIARDPGFAKARLALAQLLSDRGEHVEAARVLEQGVEAGLDGPDVQRQLAVERYRSGDADGALRAASRLLEDLPGDYGARYLKALALVELARRDEARQVLETLVAERPDGLDVALLLSRLLEDSGEIDAAAEVLERVGERLAAADRLRPSRTARLRLAELYARGERWEEVLRVSETLLEGPAASGRLDAALLKSEALAHLEGAPAALAYLEELSGSEPAPRLMARRAELLFDLDRAGEAQVALQPLADSPELDSLLLAAGVYQRVESYSDAIPLLEEARRREPGSPPILFRLGAAYERSGRYDDAEGAFRHLLDLSPDFAPALNYLGYMWAERGTNLDEAVDLVQRAIELDPDNGAYIDSLGWAYYQMGRYGEARDHLERAAELVPDDSVVYEHLGDVYLAVGERERARRIYEQALRLGGENREQVKRKLERLSGEL